MREVLQVCVIEAVDLEQLFFAVAVNTVDLYQSFPGSPPPPIWLPCLSIKYKYSPLLWAIFISHARDREAFPTSLFSRALFLQDLNIWCSAKIIIIAVKRFAL